MKPVYCYGVIYGDGAVYVDSTATDPQALSSLVDGRDARIARVKVEEHQKRSLTASALFHVWAQQIGGMVGYDPARQKAEFKIKFGYPILRQNEEMWTKLQLLFNGVDWWNLPHYVEPETVIVNGRKTLRKPCLDKIDASELIPCTSIMTTAELNRMQKDIQAYAMSEFNIQLDNGKRD